MRKVRCSLSVEQQFLDALDAKAEDLGINRSRCVERGLAKWLDRPFEFEDGRWLITRGEIDNLTNPYCYECEDPFEPEQDVILVNGYLHHGICSEG